MIAIPLMALGAFKTAGGFIARNWRLLVGAALIATVLLFCYVSGRNHERAVWEAKWALREAEWHKAIAAAAEVSRAAEAEARRIETGWRDHVSQREKEFRHEIQISEARIRELGVAGDRLRTAVEHFVKASPATADPAAACGDLRGRIETLGLLVTERDAMAGDSEREADRLGDGLRLCRGYADALKPR